MYLHQTPQPEDKGKVQLWSEILDLFINAEADVNAVIDVGSSIMTSLAMLETKWNHRKHSEAGAVALQYWRPPIRKIARLLPRKSGYGAW